MDLLLHFSCLCFSVLVGSALFWAYFQRFDVLWDQDLTSSDVPTGQPLPAATLVGLKVDSDHRNRDGCAAQTGSYMYAL